jgi:LPS O-antigen subunit length determinant protein (WzzB/FepE family)
MRNGIGIILELIVGCLLGFFGVLVSVFSDGAFAERLITVLVVLVLYGCLSALSGFLLPKYSWKSGLILAAPSAIMLFFYMLNNSYPFFNPFYVIYILVILGLSLLGAALGSTIKTR